MKTNTELLCANNECVNYDEISTTCCCRACTNKMSSNAARIVNLQRGEAKLAEFLANVPQPKCKNPDCNELCYKVPRYWKWSIFCSKKCQHKCSHLSKQPQTDEQKEITKNKKIQTFLKNYGVEHPSLSQEVRLKTRSTMLERYGFEYSGQVYELQEKRKATCLVKYGTEYPPKNNEVKQKQKETMLARYGVEHALQHKEFHDKMKQTNIERYGSEHSSGLPQFVEKRIQTVIQKYGVSSTAVLPHVINKRNQTMTDLYGGPRATYSNYTVEGIELLKDENFYKLQELNQTMTMTEIAAIHGMSLGAIQQRFTKHNVDPKIHYTSYFHKEILQYIITLKNIETLESNRRDIIGPYEIDICINDKILIECNGVYWHSETHKDSNYHLNKAIKCEAINKPLIFIWQNDWNNKRDICKSMISSLLNNNLIIDSTICELVKLHIDEYDNFFNENHIQGTSKTLDESICYGLKYNNNIVCAILFTTDDDIWKIERFCSVLFTDVVNGFQTILDHFIIEYNPLIITSSFPRQWNDNKVHKMLGFELCTTSSPNCLYTNDYRELITLDQKNLIDPNNELYNWDRAWNCGDNIYVWKVL